MLQASVRKLLMPRPSQGCPDRAMRLKGFDCLGDPQQGLGWVKSPNDPVAVICFFHGNGENAADWVSNLDFIIDDYNCALALMEYPGYAVPSDKLASNSQELVQHAIDGIGEIRAKRNFSDIPIVLWGRSLGGAVATAVAERTSVDGLILESTFSSIGTLAGDLFSLVPKRIVAALVKRFPFDTELSLKKVTCPLLITHSNAEQMINFSHAERNFAAAINPKQLVTLAGGHNDDKHQQPAFREALDQFADIVRDHVTTA